LSFELLKKRALSFLRDAKFDLESGDYGLMLFHAEQFAQLYSKYLVYKRIGDFPKTHSLTRLPRDLVKIYDDCRLKVFLDKNLESLY
jgi:HEPN domain-containing protein